VNKIVGPDCTPGFNFFHYFIFKIPRFRKVDILRVRRTKTIDMAAPSTVVTPPTSNGATATTVTSRTAATHPGLVKGLSAFDDLAVLNGWGPDKIDAMKTEFSMKFIMDMATGRGQEQEEKVDNTKVFCDVLHENAERVRFQWKNNAATCNALIKRYKEDYDGDRVKAVRTLIVRYESRAKARSLIPIEQVVGGRLLYGDPANITWDAFLLLCIIFNTSSDQQLAVHNWDVAHKMDKGNFDAMGKHIDVLPVPLFNETSEALRELNFNLLEQVASMPTGGEPEPRPRVRRIAELRNSVTGAGVLHCIDLAGNPSGYSDATPVENALNGMQERIIKLEAELAEHKARARNRATSQQMGVPQPQRQQQGQQQAHQQGRGGYQQQRNSGRGQGQFGNQGRGRGGRAWGGDAAPQETDF
jgi:hypothetical protein